MNTQNVRSKTSPFLIISAITAGGALEWYEIGMFIFFPTIVLGQAIGIDARMAESINRSVVPLIIAIVLANGGARSLGGWLFGRRGDKTGRRGAFMLTVLVATLPSIILTMLAFFLPLEKWITFSPIIFTIIKIFQGIPAGGELSGAICYLAEDDLRSIGSQKTMSRRFMSSFTLVGPQIGLALSTVICLILHEFFSLNFLLTYGWKLVFLVSSILGIGGFALRKKLHETSDFLSLKIRHKILGSPIKNLFQKHLPMLIFASLISIYEIVSFSAMSVMPIYYSKYFQMTQIETIIISVGFFVLGTLSLPLIGKISSKYSNISWLQIGAWGGLCLAIPLYLTLLKGYFLLSLIFNLLILLLYSIHAAILPSVLAELFPIQIRYSGIAFSFSVCDGILWSFVTSVSFIIISSSRNPYFLWVLPVCAIIFLLTGQWKIGKHLLVSQKR